MTESNTRKCPLCQQETAANHEFCDRCGREIGNHCIECGAERSGRGAFCVKCGHEFRPFPKVTPGVERAREDRSISSVEEVASDPLLPVWFKRFILGSVILFVVAALGIWLTVWFMRQWAEMKGDSPDTVVASGVQSKGDTGPQVMGEPIVIPDSMPIFSKDPRWQARFEQLYVEYLPKFKPLPEGSRLEVETRTGVRMTGTVTSISNRLVMLSRDGMEIGFPAEQLKLNTLSQLFREEFAHYYAGLEVEREQVNEGQRQSLRTVAPTRSAQRPEVKSGVKAGPAPGGAPPTEFQADMAIFKRSMGRLVISILVIIGVIVVVRHLW